MARRSKKKREGMESSWLASYGDMVTLLLCFFVLLYSMTTIDVEKFKSLTESMKQALGAESEMVDIDPFADALDSPEEEADEEELEDDMEQIEELKKQVDELIVIAGLENAVHTEVDDRGLLVRMSTDELLFDLGSATIKPGAIAFLDSIAGIIGQIANEIVVEGHTDDIPIQHGALYPTNWELSTARASSVIRHVIAAGAIDPRRVQASGYADSRPRFPNDTAEHRSMNRRVEILVRPVAVPKKAADGAGGGTGEQGGD